MNLVIGLVCGPYFFLLHVCIVFRSGSGYYMFVLCLGQGLVDGLESIILNIGGRAIMVQKEQPRPQTMPSDAQVQSFTMPLKNRLFKRTISFVLYVSES